MMNIKALIEKRNALVAELEALVEKANTETRGLTNDELATLESKKSELANLDRTIEESKELRSIQRVNAMPETTVEKNKEVLEVKAFEHYLRGTFGETRGDDANMTFGDNGAVVPTSIANKIIEKVVEISPLYNMATRYKVKGTLTIPYYDTTSGDITVDYADEFTDLISTSGKFASITMTGFLAGVLTKVSKSLINNSQFDIVSYVINKMAQNIAIWIEGELIPGTASKISGLSTLSASVTAAAATSITSDELIRLQESIPDAYQANAVWIMSKATRTAIRLLRDGQGNYLLNRDFGARWGYTLLGKEVYVSKNMPDMAANAKAIYYGDFSGLAVKETETAEIAVLREKFATQHAVGVFAYIEMDSKVENAEKLALLKMGATDPQ
ncbi:phage major capsid protein [Ralstonia pseudosolanacearum]|uniref:phage major capsid protein n=1 Tax=Ralstonia pseudosolanacearum TaxID=1310165 RepID=UPI003D17D88B